MDIIHFLVFLAICVVFVFALIGLLWLFDRFVVNGVIGEFMAIGVYSFKNGSCPKISFKKVSG